MTDRRCLRLTAVTLLAVATTLAACNRDKAPSARAPATPVAAAPETLADAGAPFDYVSKTPFAEVKMTLPQTIKGQPELHVQLYSNGVKELRQFTEGAQADRTEAGGDSGQAAYDKEITFDSVVDTGKLFSLARSAYEFTGGAHGITNYSGVIWDKALKRAVEPAALFRPGVTLNALDAALCAALNVEKKTRDPQAATLKITTGAEDGDWTCPHAADTAFALAAGTTPGKAGGLTFLVGPYIAGPYAEGSYWVNVPQSAVRPLLAPAYADEFAGNPVPLTAPK